MFSDSPIVTTGFTVLEEVQRKQDDATSQTSEVDVHSQGIQTVLTRDSSEQTDLLCGLKYPPPFDSDKLANFLTRIYPDLLNELNRSEMCYNSYKYASDEDDTVVQMHFIEPEKSKRMRVSSLSWNCTGVSLAVSFCEPAHKLWCTHPGKVHVYNTSKKDFAKISPEHTLDFNFCVKLVSFHPSELSILVTCLHPGGIHVFDLETEDPFSIDFGGLYAGIHGHSEGATNIVWINEGISSNFVTTSTDGKIIIWKLIMSTKSLQALEVYCVPSIHCNPKNYSEIDGFAEVLSISFWPSIKTEFVIAIAGGHILHCLRKCLQTKTEFIDPVLSKYEPHPGIVTCVRCSTLQELFATCGTDCEIRVYKARERSPLHVIHSDFPLVGIEWISDANAVIACWGSSSNVSLYRVKTKVKLDSHSVVLPEESESQITAVKLNKHRKGVLAVGTESGEISIWKIPEIDT